MPHRFEIEPTRERQPPFRLVAIWAIVLQLAWPSQAGGALDEYSVKAAFLYNFAQFIQWPPGTYSSSRDAIVLGVLGGGEFPPDLQAISGRSVPGHGQNRVILLKHMTSPQEIDHCQILFILRSGDALLPEAIREAAARNILTVVEDADDLAQTGAVINLFKTGENRIRFEINVDAAKRADLTIDSPLLNLAKMVREHPPRPGN